MEATSNKPRRPWLAALLSLLGGPIGQVYGGDFRRFLILGIIVLSVSPALALVAPLLPWGRLVIAVFVVCVVGVNIFLAIDAFRVARQNRNVSLKPYQRGWCYVSVLAGCWLAHAAMAHAVRTYMVEAFVVPTDLMHPTIRAGDRILVDKFWFRPSRLQRNDLVAYRGGQRNAPLLVQRAVALPGDVVEMANAQLFVNGTRLAEFSAILNEQEPVDRPLDDYGPITIPLDDFMALGDNWRESQESHLMGPVPMSTIYGRAFLVY